jgi:hypothetical protein
MRLWSSVMMQNIWTKQVKENWSLHQYDFLAQRQKVQDTLEEKLCAIECDSGNVEVQWKNIKECVLVLSVIWLGK